MDLLLKAVEYLDDRDRGSDHIYAATITKNIKVKSENKIYRTKFTSNRKVHNELEKSRRAKLKHCLDSLKSVIPNLETSTKFTQIKLLRAATDYIELLKRENKTCDGFMKDLATERFYLKEKLKKLPFVQRVRSHSLSSFESNEDGETSTDGQRATSDSDSECLVEVS